MKENQNKDLKQVQTIIQLNLQVTLLNRQQLLNKTKALPHHLPPAQSLQRALLQDPDLQGRNSFQTSRREFIVNVRVDQ